MHEDLYSSLCSCFLAVCGGRIQCVYSPGLSLAALHVLYLCTVIERDGLVRRRNGWNGKCVRLSLELLPKAETWFSTVS
jgi:hypothetical protein